MEWRGRVVETWQGTLRHGMTGSMRRASEDSLTYKLAGYGWWFFPDGWNGPGIGCHQSEVKPVRRGEAVSAV